MACVKNRYVIAENSAGLLCYTNRIMSLFTRIKGPCYVLQDLYPGKNDNQEQYLINK